PGLEGVQGHHAGLHDPRRARPYPSSGAPRPAGLRPPSGERRHPADGLTSRRQGQRGSDSDRGDSDRGGGGREGWGQGGGVRGGRGQLVNVIRKTGWSGAMRRSSSSEESGPTPLKNTPTSAFQRLR